MESLNVVKFPVGNNLSYLQIENPDFLTSIAKKSKCPVSVTSYKNENNESLKYIKNSIIRRLDEQIELRKPNLKGAIKRSLVSGSIAGFSGAVASYLLNDGTEFFSVLGDYSQLVSDLITVGYSLGSGIYALGTGKIIKSHYDKRKQHKNFLKGKKALKETPIEKFETTVNKELENLNSCIENGYSLSNIEKFENFEDGIIEVLGKAEKSLIPEAKLLYNQIADSNKRLLI